MQRHVIYSHYHRSDGWTLIEVMVALVLIACMSALGYRSISTLITTESALREKSEQLFAVDTAFSVADNDWTTQSAKLVSDTPPPIDPDKPSNTNHSLDSKPLDQNIPATQWEFTPINGWIPAPVMPRIPPEIQPYLTRTYTINYQAAYNGGIDRLVGCAPPQFPPTTPTVCQKWHMLGNWPTSVHGTFSQTTQHREMEWHINTPEGPVERFWAFSPPSPQETSTENNPKDSHDEAPEQPHPEP